MMMMMMMMMTTMTTTTTTTIINNRLRRGQEEKTNRTEILSTVPSIAAAMGEWWHSHRHCLSNGRPSVSKRGDKLIQRECCLISESGGGQSQTEY